MTFLVTKIFWKISYIDTLILNTGHIKLIMNVSTMQDFGDVHIWLRPMSFIKRLTNFINGLDLLRVIMKIRDTC